LTLGALGKSGFSKGAASRKSLENTALDGLLMSLSSISRSVNVLYVNSLY